jgi:phage-related protein
MNYHLEFFNHTIKADIENWPPGILANFVRIAETMTEYGPNLGLPYTRALGSGLFEIRAKGAEGIGRALFCMKIDKRIVILHGFIKKTQQTPSADLKLVRKRMKEVVHDNR